MKPNLIVRVELSSGVHNNATNYLTNDVPRLVILQEYLPWQFSRAILAQPEDRASETRWVSLTSKYT